MNTAMRIFAALLILLAFVLVFMVGSPALAHHRTWHDKGGEEEPPPPPEPAMGSIDLLTCDNDGGIATWPTPKVRYRILNVSGVRPQVIGAIQAGIQEWNTVQSTYTLIEVPNNAVLDIEVYFKLVPGSTLGAAAISCPVTANGIQSALILLGTKGLKLIGLQNVVAHEIGHALGLGHADVIGDLLDPRFEQKEEGRTIVCPSTLDVGGLTATENPHTMPLADWAEIICD